MSLPVADALEIARLVARLAMAADDRDAAAYRLCLFDWVDTALPGELPEVARANEYVQSALARLGRFDWTHHRPGETLLEPGATRDRLSGVADVAVGIGWSDPQGRGRAATAGGRYHLGFIRKDGDWRICGRSVVWRYYAGDLPPAFP